MPATPTEEGSIVAYLRLNDSDWNAKLDAAEQRARDLGRISPDIRITADTADALAKIEAVRLAAEQAGGNHVTRFTTVNESVNTASGNGAGYYGAIAAAVAGLVPLMGDLAGYAVGVSGAFAGMGAAGVLAVLGIKNAMAAGTDIGNAYTTSVGQLKDALNGLEQTAAADLLAPFQQSVAAIVQAMPQLTSEIDGFSAELGVIGNSVVGTLIQGFQILNPLFMQGADYLGHLAGAWSAWVSGGGLMQFALDAQRTLPEVASALGSVAKGAIDLVGALAPIGDVVLPIVTDLGDLVQWLASAGPALAVVAGGAAAAFGAFKLWGVIGPLVASAAEAVYGLTDSTVALGIALDAASGPVGIVVAALGGLAAAIGIGVAATQQATQAEADYAQALQVSHGAIDQNVRDAAAKALADAKVLETARQYHIELSRLTDAVLGNAADQQYVTAQVEKYGMTMHATTGAAGQLGASYRGLSGDAKTLLDVVNGNNKSLNEQIQAYRDQAAASGTSASASANLSAVQKQLSDAQSTVTKDTTALANALSALGAANRSADQANIAYQQSLDTASTAVQQNGRSLDETTKAGRANATALDGIANAGIALITAQAKQDASEQTLQNTMTTTRQNFIDTAVQMGDTTDQANKLADQFGLIPSQVATVYTTSGLGDAIQQVQTLQNAIDALLSDENAVNLGGNVAGYYGFGAPKGSGHAMGGMLAAAGRAAGGQITGPGNAMSDTAGMYYPVSDHEWIISNIQGQASKWSPMLDAVNRNAPEETVIGRAMRIAGMQPTERPQTVIHQTHNWTIYTNNAEQLFQAFTAKINGGAAV